MIDSYIGSRGSVFLTNATAGFELAFKYANLSAGDEVIVPAITFIATMAYPLAVGAKVVLADVDERTLNMDPKDVARKITRKTKMIVPVHIGGYPVDMDPIMDLAKERSILVLEDAAHAFGGKYKGRALGTIGHFGAFSFHEVKNITSFGEGGVLVSSLPIAAELKRARFLGMNMQKKIPDWFYDVEALPGKYGPFVAGNSSSTEIQALGLLGQLARYDAILAQRRENARYVSARLSQCRGVFTPPVGGDGTESTAHLYCLRVDPKIVHGGMVALRQKLDSRGVTSIPHFAPLYKFEILRQLGYDTAKMAASCPVTEALFPHRFTHLPIYGLSPQQLDYMTDSIIESVGELSRAP
jgi:dTDP-4-amino-4,6-dideoxygalactose transaminase